MDQKTEGFPGGYYVRFASGPPGVRDYWLNSDGSVIAMIYKSLDGGHGSPPVEHVIRVGGFHIPNAKTLSLDLILQQIREEILRINKRRREN